MDVRRGVVKSFNAVTYKATVQVAGSLSVWLEEVPSAPFGKLCPLPR